MAEPMVSPEALNRNGGKETMDLYVIEVDGLDVAMADSERAALSYARVLTLEDPGVDVRVFRISDGPADRHSWLRVAEAATA